MITVLTILSLVIGYVLGAAIGFPTSGRGDMRNRVSFLSLLKEGDEIIIDSPDTYSVYSKRIYKVLGNDPTTQMLQVKMKNRNYEQRGMKYGSRYLKDVMGDNLSVVKGRKRKLSKLNWNDKLKEV